MLEYQKRIFLAETWMNMAVAQLHEQKIDTALFTMEKALQLLPKEKGIVDLGVFYDFYGEIQMQKGQMKQALANFQKALDIDPNLANAYANYALCNALQAEESSKPRRISFSFSYNNSQGSTSFETESSSQNQKSAYDLSLVLLNKAIKLEPNNYGYYHLRGDFKRLLGMPDFCLDYQNASLKGSSRVQSVIAQFCK